MTKVSSLGHVGLYCSDLDAQLTFYTELLGLQVTDEDREHGMIFLSARPEIEHHELALFSGRNVGSEAQVVQQLSFHCDSLETLIAFYRRFQEEEVTLDMVASHGNAISIYMLDPDGNRCEVYWPTGLSARQPYIVPADLDADPAEILDALSRSVAEFGATGVIDESAFAGKRI